MNTMKLVFAAATTMAVVLFTITIVATTQRQTPERSVEVGDYHETYNGNGVPSETPVKHMSHRFLAEKNPRAVENLYHCNKDDGVCSLRGSPGPSCCLNKCVDMMTNKHNCGACKNKCKFSEACCGGKCVNLSFDKRHCGQCNQKCMTGGYCIYGMCDYA